MITQKDGMRRLMRGVWKRTSVGRHPRPYPQGLCGCHEKLRATLCRDQRRPATLSA